MKTQYVGIDYGMGQSNRNKETGIRNGVIHMNEVCQAWCDSSEPYYGKPDSVECPDCGRSVKAKAWGETVTCDGDECQTQFEAELPDCAEPISHYYEQDGYSAECGESGDIFVCRSPYFTYAQFCSPCAPGACYLTNPLDEPNDNNRAYCLGHDWFDDGKAPYPVYSVETRELINP